MSEVLTPEVVAAEEPQLSIEIAQRGRSIAIVDNQSYEASLAVTAEAKRRIRILEQMRKDDKLLVLEQARKIDARWNGLKAPYEDLVAELTPRQIAWHEEQERQRREAERKAVEEAERERARLQRQAEADVRKAEVWRESGNEEKAERFEERAVDKMLAASEVIPAVIQTIKPPEGTSFTGRWKADCIDISVLIDAAYGRQSQDERLAAIARGFLRVEFNQQAANSFAASTKGAVKVPGISFRRGTSIRQ